MALRFANGLFEPIWNRDRIDHVQITVAETIGVEGRGKFYEETGALRDMVPNHLFSAGRDDRRWSRRSASMPRSSATKKAEMFKAMPAVKPERCGARPI